MSKPQLVIMQLVSGINQEMLDEWIAYRAEDKKKPMTPRAIKMTTKFLSKYSEEEQERLICLAIRNNWEGLHYVPPEKGRSTRDMDLREMLTDTSWAD